jgi:hypothetical protein
MSTMDPTSDGGCQRPLRCSCMGPRRCRRFSGFVIKTFSLWILLCYWCGFFLRIFAYFACRCVVIGRCESSFDAPVGSFLREMG